MRKHLLLTLIMLFGVLGGAIAGEVSNPTLKTGLGQKVYRLFAHWHNGNTNVPLIINGNSIKTASSPEADGSLFTILDNGDGYYRFYTADGKPFNYEKNLSGNTPNAVAFYETQRENCLAWAVLDDVLYSAASQAKTLTVKNTDCALDQYTKAKNIYYDQGAVAINTYTTDFILQEETDFVVYTVNFINSDGSTPVSYNGSIENCLTTSPQSDNGFFVFKSTVNPSPTDFNAGDGEISVNSETKTITVTFTNNVLVTFNITATNGVNDPINLTLKKYFVVNETAFINENEYDYFSDFRIQNQDIKVTHSNNTFTVTASHNLPMIPGKFYHIRYINNESEQYYLNYVDNNNVSVKAAKNGTDPKNIWYIKNIEGTTYFSICNVYTEKAVHGKDNSNKASEFVDEFAYEFVKANSNFRLFEGGTMRNLGAHGWLGSASNTALGGWINQNASNRNWGTEYLVEEIDESIFNITNGLEGYVGSIPNFGAFNEARTAYNASKTVANLKSILAAYNNLGSRIELSENKFYRIRHKGSIGVESGAYHPYTWLTSTLSQTSNVDNNRMTLTHSETPNSTATFFYDGTNIIAYQNGLFAHENTTSMEPFAWSIEKQENDYAYYLKNNSNYLIYWGWDGNANQASANYTFMKNESGDWAAWYIQEVTELPISIATSGYTTMYSPVSLTVPAELEAYTATVDEGRAVVTYTKVSDIPANTGVLLYRTSGKSETSTPHTLRTNGTTGTQTSDLKGEAYTQEYNKDDNTVAGESLNDKYVYTLQSGKFKWYTGTKLTGFKAHLELKDGRETGNARTYTFSFDDNTPTGITEIDGMIESNASIYDLSGRKMTHLQKGINIVNGKKVIR